MLVAESSVKTYIDLPFKEKMQNSVERYQERIEGLSRNEEDPEGLYLSIISFFHDLVSSLNAYRSHAVRDFQSGRALNVSRDEIKDLIRNVNRELESIAQQRSELLKAFSLASDKRLQVRSQLH